MLQRGRKRRIRPNQRATQKLPFFKKLMLQLKLRQLKAKNIRLHGLGVDGQDAERTQIIDDIQRVEDQLIEDDKARRGF